MEVNRSDKMKKKSKVPPTVPEIPHKVYEIDGNEVWDDFFWLREKDNPKVLKYLEDENAYAESMMEHTTELQTDLYYEFAGRLSGDTKSAYQQVDNYYYYTREEEEKQYSMHCRKFESLDNEEQIYFDENEEAEGEDYFALGPFEVSPDHNLLAYGIDIDGDERFTLKIKNLATNTWLDEEISSVGWTVRWAADNMTLLYTKVDEHGRTDKLYRHTIGENSADGSDDELLFEEKDDIFMLKISTTNNRKFFLLHIHGQITREMWFMPTSQPRGQFQVVTPRERGVIYSVHSHGNYFYIHTNEGGAKNFKVVKAPNDDPSNRENWEDVLPYRESVLVDSIILFRHHFVAFEWEGTFQKIRVQDLSDGDTLSNTQYFNSNLMRFSYTSFIQPTIVYDYDMDNRRKRKQKEVMVPGLVKDQYHQKRIFAKTHDGQLVPISLVYKVSLRDANGGNPLLLMGYGAYGDHKLPAFIAERLSLLDRGFIFAIAHIRGDADIGWQWYEDGKLLRKKNTFLDFISCAEHLIEQGYTTSDKLAIHGRSAGGLLIGAVVNMRPDLFKLAVTDVPFVDVIGSMSDPTIPWTAFEWEEWGDPRDRETFDYMMSYSPYVNVKAQDYPHMLITTGLNDPRVCYWEPAKFTSKLRKLKTDNNVLLLKTYLSGHMGASGRYDAIQELAFAYAFIIDRLGVASSVTASKPLMQVISSPVSITPPDLLAMFHGYQVTMILHAALDLGIFNTLKRQPNFQADEQTLADETKANRFGLRRLLDALVSVGILGTEDEYYTLTEIAATHLVEGMPGYIGDLRYVLANEFTWKSFRQLSDAIRQGGAVEEVPPSVALNTAQHYASGYRHAGFELVAVLSSWALRKKSLNVLDLYCGNGLLGYSLAQKLNNVHVWSLDSPNVLAVAKKYAEEMGVTHRVQYIESSQFEDNTGRSYDLIIVGQNVLNILGDTDSISNLLQQISQSLKSTGRVVFYETVSGIGTSPYPELFSVSMFVTRKHGKVRTLSWYKDLLTKAGFANPTVYDLQPFPEKLLISNRNILTHSKSQSKKT